MSAMLKLTLILLLLATGCATRTTDKPELSGGMSHHFAMTLAYEPPAGTNAAHFIITLSNTSGRNWNALIEPEWFEGSIVLEKATKEKKVYGTHNYWIIMLAANKGNSVSTIKRGEKIVWRIPVSELLNMQSEFLKLEDLKEASIHAELRRFSIWSKPEMAIESNAEQVTPGIKL